MPTGSLVDDEYYILATLMVVRKRLLVILSGCWRKRLRVT